MKVLILLGLLAFSAAAPQQRKLFHEHFDDFMQLIGDVAGHDLDHLTEHYFEFEEFQATMEYLKTDSFKNLVYEMESLPEFNAVIEFLEKDNIDIYYFLDFFNNLIENNLRSLTSRHTLSGTNFNAFITDIISEFPKTQLAELFEQKKAEYEDFRVAVDNLYSEEWHEIFGALFASESFQNEIKVLEENGIDIHMLLTEVKAVFGQN